METKHYNARTDGQKAAPSAADMEAINALALTPQEPEAVYTRRFLACHNLVDRTGERFTEAALDDMAATLNGKSFFVKGHPGYGDNGPGHGRIFKTETATMSLKEFNALTGENAALPPGVANVKAVWAHVYMLRQFNAEIIANIEAGIYTFVSVGFNARREAKMADDNVVQYFELDAPCDGMELSLVWLGAQQGAAAKGLEVKVQQLIERMEAAQKVAEGQGATPQAEPGEPKQPEVLFPPDAKILYFRR